MLGSDCMDECKIKQRSLTWLNKLSYTLIYLPMKINA